MVALLAAKRRQTPVRVTGFMAHGCLFRPQTASGRKDVTMLFLGWFCFVDRDEAQPDTEHRYPPLAWSSVHEFERVKRSSLYICYL